MKKLFSLLLCCLMFTALSCGYEATEEDIVAKMTEAQGGKDALMAINDQVATWEMNKMAMMPPGMPSDGVPFVMTYKRPNKMRMEMMGPGGQAMTVGVYDGEKGWDQVPDPNSGAMMTMEQMGDKLEANRLMAATWVDGYMNYKDLGMTMTKVASDPENSDKHIVMKCKQANGDVQTLYINPTSYHVEKQVGPMINDETQMKEEMTLTFSDYYMYDGMALPKLVVLYDKDNKMMWEATLKSAKNNTGVSDDLFMMPKEMSSK